MTRRTPTWLPLVAAALCGMSAAAAADRVPVAPQRFVHGGVAVEFSTTGAEGGPVREGRPARVRFTLTDVASGQPIRRAHPAAWLSRRSNLPGAQPRTCAEKVREFLGGSVFGRADLDLNGFQVLALNDDATITVVDPLFGFGGTRLLAMIELPGVGEDWALTPDGKTIVVTVPTADRIVIVDTATWTIRKKLESSPRPRRVTVQPDGHYAWIAGEKGVDVVALDRSEITARLTTGSGRHEIAFDADSRWAFVSNATERTLSVIDVRSLATSKDIALGVTPTALAYSRAAQAVYVTSETGAAIAVVDAAKHEVVARVEAAPGAAEIRFAPSERYALVACPAGDLVLVLDAATNRIVQRAKIERGPEQFAFSGDLAFVRRRGTASVGMIPLAEIGRENRALPVAEFTGGEAAFGTRTTPAGGLMAAPGEAAVVVANPADKAIYYYMEGMAAPMGNFGNYGRQPRAVLVLDRSLAEIAPGTYETTADLPAAGDYDAVFFVDSPRITYCFDARIDADPENLARRTPAVWLEPLSPAVAAAGQPVRSRFRIHAGQSLAPAPADLTVRTLLAPGVWHTQLRPTIADDGTFAVEFTPPEPGRYYFYAESSALGLGGNQPPCLVLTVGESPTAAR